jgi:hypothetical protein
MSVSWANHLAPAKAVLSLLFPGKMTVVAASTAAVVVAVMTLPPARLADSSGRLFRIDAVTTAALAPQASVPLELWFTNPNSVDFVVTDLTAEISGVHAPGACGPADFEVSQFSGGYGFVVSGLRRTSLSQLGIATAQWPHLTMMNRPVNQDGCRNALVTLRFTGKAAGVP